MTQIFDQETGVAHARDRDPGRAVPGRLRPHAGRDGYDAVQLAFDEVPERKLTKPERGHLRRTASARTAGSSRSAASTTSLPARRVTVEVFEPGEKVKVSGVSIGKGFQGTIKRHVPSRAR